MSRYDITFFEYFQNFKRQIRTNPLNLGGIVTGSGGPPGGFIGYLPQTRVSYDELEAAFSGYVNDDAVSASGILVNVSLLDNLNHIRYRLEALEGTASFAVYDNGILVADGITVLDFDNNLYVSDAGSGYINITSSGGAGEIEIQENDTTVISGATILNFEGDVNVVDDGGGKVTVTISGAASAGELIWDLVTNGDAVDPGLVFTEGDVIWTQVG